MNLETYLAKIANNTDTKLIYEFGIYDNFPILLDVTKEKFVSDLIKSARFEKSDERKMHSTLYEDLNFIPGTINMRVYGHVAPGFTTGNGFNLSAGEKTESQKQIANHQIALTLHPYQKRKIEGISDLQVVALITNEIANYAIKENIGLCLPNSSGWNYLDNPTENLNRIIYYRPKSQANKITPQKPKFPRERQATSTLK